jgi:predicted MFS family arabinose efflux permease
MTDASESLRIGAKPTSSAVPRGAWTIATLLFFYMVVNFADKVIVGLAGVPLMRDLNINAAQFGFLGSAFFFLFSISAIVVGLLADKFPTRWILLILGLIWAVTQLPMIGEVSFATLVVCRIILGAGEGPAFSIALHALYKWFPDEKRALPTAILSQGSAMGVVFAVPALNYIILNYTWHWAFGALGLVGLLWSAVWLLVGREGPLADAKQQTSDGRAYSYWRLIGTPTFIGASLATFGAYWVISVGLTWFTPFLIKGLGYSQERAGFLSILPWFAGAVVVLATGYTSQRMVLRGVSTRYARAVLGAAPLIVAGVMMLIMTRVQSPPVVVALLVAAGAASGSIYPMCPPMLGEFTPSSQRGGVLAAYGALYTLSGVLAPYFMGKIVQSAENPLAGYMTGFAFNGVLLIISGVLGLLLMWPNREKARLAGHTVAL